MFVNLTSKTIYREETGFDENLKIDINFAEMELIAVLKKSEVSWIFHVNYFGKPWALKVAILIEYLPNPLPMNSNTYSKKCFEKVNIGIQQIHLALILHNDPYSKNVLIVPGDPEREENQRDGLPPNFKNY
ncbi:hypothetical protein BDBG_00411 [Blastomyces gilchristii SLH14081]|uniref:Protein kinase domain-containing protein n=1 Tax=Blastomyces gilchristii (strain SLH14081) TaxID=559298 RepID=A0A179U6W9_BLAGS|nr:uncharacterized protein BDBG_00411 [Blastomyces gilchristii SLH14081]EQL34060.1 hypothetical protein BDFG_03980 [Blastomyces dermatitidis ATCC 26199]OAT03724.1 hypothetical protein BDBG_00411 [Blastomyces gilchristii SLH14081]